MIESNLINNSLKFVENYYAVQDPQLPYHNLDLALSYAKVASQLVKKTDMLDTQKENLVIAALFQDIGYAKDRKNHEEISSKIAHVFLKSQNVSTERINLITQYILATKDGYEVNGDIELLMKDISLSDTSSKNYLDNIDKLIEEESLLQGQEFSELQFIENHISFIKNNPFLSPNAKKKLAERRMKNLNKLMKMKPKESSAMAASKTAQTQLKTTLRNHINLSSIADNKANMMLSINTLVLTVGLPLMSGQISEDKYYAIPIIVMAVTSTVSMIFATLSTRPVKMSGYTDLAQIPLKKTNLFFFGNFFKMNFDDYENGIQKVIKDDPILENSITRDLFFLGKAIGKKYSYLRICYNIFLIGVSISSILYILVSVSHGFID
jgi:hypothetical protein